MNNNIPEWLRGVEADDLEPDTEITAEDLQAVNNIVAEVAPWLITDTAEVLVADLDTEEQLDATQKAPAIYEKPKNGFNIEKLPYRKDRPYTMEEVKVQYPGYLEYALAAGYSPRETLLMTIRALANPTEA